MVLVGIGALAVGHVGVRPGLIDERLEGFRACLIEAEIGDQRRRHLVAGKAHDFAEPVDVAGEFFRYVVEGKLLRVDGKSRRPAASPPNFQPSRPRSSASFAICSPAGSGQVPRQKT